MIEVQSLTKKFDQLEAVSGISFSAHKGQVLGFLGPNGAGKSTTMKMLTGFINPSSGDATICGHSILQNRQQAQKKIGYVSENAPLYDEMYVIEFLKFIARLRGLDELTAKGRIDYVVSICSLEAVLNQKIETLSKGYKRRVSLAQALVHDPEVLILDEPTDGLDPNQKHDVRVMIKKLSTDKCILVSTHILEEVDEICDQVIIIGNGKLLFNGTPDALRSKSKHGRIQNVFRAITTNAQVEGVEL